MLDAPVSRSTVFITGTDTDVGKTVLACLLAGYLRDRGVVAAALKPVCAGGRDDARQLQAASGGALTLDEINPWHFRLPFAPLMAARREKRKVKLAQVLAHVRGIQKRFPTAIIEGAGGLLSPLGDTFDSRDLILALRATPIVVCPNRLGAINQALLVLAALPRSFAERARIVLMSSRRPDNSSRSNPRALAEMLGRDGVYVLPWLEHPEQAGWGTAGRRVRQVLYSLVQSSGWCDLERGIHSASA